MSGSEPLDVKLRLRKIDLRHPGIGSVYLSLFKSFGDSRASQMCP